jgi:hypothetical protein
MKTKLTRLQRAGIGLHVLVGGLMLFACSGKAFGFAPEQVVSTLTEAGLGDQIRMIGMGGLISALLLLIPTTEPLGALAVSAYWGGAICLHMARHEPYVVQSVLVLMTWAGDLLRRHRATVAAPAAGVEDRELAAASAA